jgi:hypothetical protein
MRGSSRRQCCSVSLDVIPGTSPFSSLSQLRKNTYGIKVVAINSVVKPHCLYTNGNAAKNVKINASLNPDNNEQHSTIGSRTNISNGRIHVLSSFLGAKRSCSSSIGPYTCERAGSTLRSRLAARSKRTRELVSGVKKWKNWTAAPNMS